MRRVSFPSPRVETRLHVCEAHRNEMSISTSGGNTIHERGAPTRNSRSVCNYESTTGGSCRFHPCSNRNCARIEGPYANGGRGRGKRHEARKRVCHRANTFHRSARRVPRPRFGTTARRYPSNVGASPPVLGPCQWHRAYRARSRSNRGEPSAHEAARPARTEHARPRSSPALRFGGRGGGKRERPSGGGSVRADRGSEPSVILYPCASRVVSQRLNAH